MGFGVGILIVLETFFFVGQVKFTIFVKFIDNFKEVFLVKIFLAKQIVNLINDLKKFLVLGVNGLDIDTVFGIPNEIHGW
jgi:hypothetical protein